MKNFLAGSVLALSLAACSDRTPQVIAVPQAMPPAAAAAAQAPGAMTVSGSATLEVSPDCADLTMTMSADGAKPGLAAAAIKKKQDDAIAAMKKLGLDAADMKISHINLNPIYRSWPHELKVATYRAEITITATTKQFDQIAAMMEGGANAGAQTLSVQFRRSDLPELKKKVREMALKAAREKAELTAKTLGIGLGRVTAVGETHAGHMWGSHYFPSNIVVNAMEAAPVAAAQTNAIALGGALQPLTLDVSVSYEFGRT
jgi:uncharacterized protein